MNENNLLFYSLKPLRSRH